MNNEYIKLSSVYNIYIIRKLSLKIYIFDNY